MTLAVKAVAPGFPAVLPARSWVNAHRIITRSWQC